MTKEMRPSHRIDVLSVALEHYCIQTKGKLGLCVYMHQLSVLLFANTSYVSFITYLPLGSNQEDKGFG